MRNFIISLTCLAFVVAIWSVFDSYALSKTLYYEEQINTILVSYISENRWDEAREAFEDLHEDWEGYKKRASYFLDNNAINHIDSTFNKIVFYISADDLSNSSGELAYLNGLFESLYQNESLAPQNIF